MTDGDNDRFDKGFLMMDGYTKEEIRDSINLNTSFTSDIDKHKVYKNAQIHISDEYKTYELNNTSTEASETKRYCVTPYDESNNCKSLFSDGLWSSGYICLEYTLIPIMDCFLRTVYDDSTEYRSSYSPYQVIRPGKSKMVFNLKMLVINKAIELLNESQIAFSMVLFDKSNICIVRGAKIESWNMSPSNGIYSAKGTILDIEICPNIDIKNQPDFLEKVMHNIRGLSDNSKIDLTKTKEAINKTKKPPLTYDINEPPKPDPKLYSEYGKVEKNSSSILHRLNSSKTIVYGFIFTLFFIISGFLLGSFIAGIGAIIPVFIILSIKHKKQFIKGNYEEGLPELNWNEDVFDDNYVEEVKYEDERKIVEDLINKYFSKESITHSKFMNYLINCDEVFYDNLDKYKFNATESNYNNVKSIIDKIIELKNEIIIKSEENNNVDKVSDDIDELISLLKKFAVIK